MKNKQTIKISKSNKVTLGNVSISTGRPKDDKSKKSLTNDVAHSLRDLIIDNKLKEAFEQLMQLFKSDKGRYNETIHLFSRYNQFRQEKRLDIISPDEYLLNMNKLKNALLELIDSIV